MRVPYHRQGFAIAFGALVVLAWTALGLWAASPYARYVEHGDWTRIGLAGALCAAVPAGGTLVPAALYAGSWVLMLIAMMLPTTLPLLEIYRRLTRRRADRWLLLSLVVMGYLLVWFGFGLAAHAADLALNQVAARSAWLTLNAWAVGAAVLALAGAFQFSAIKYRCLDKCRPTLSFVIGHWRGRRERLDAFRMGLRHGGFCVGCCWALMLLMFVLGTGNVGWMLLLGAVMAAEKNLPWGRRLRAPLGFLLIAAAGAVAADGALLRSP